MFIATHMTAVSSSPKARKTDMCKPIRMPVAILVVSCIAAVHFANGQANGQVTRPIVIDVPELRESSGIAFSTRTNDLLFSHNDSGDAARLFAFNLDGKFVYQLEIENATAKDWEDMCSFEYEGKNWLAVGDIGDNEFKRDSVAIYVLKEPKEKAGDKRRKSEFEYELHVEYAGGPVNSEALAYDPINHSFVMLSKENLKCVIYEVAIPAEPKKENRVKAKPIAQQVIPMVTGADISRDGKKMVICTYGPSCLIERNPASENEPWKKLPSEFAKTLFQTPPRRQGEAICFSPQAAHVWLTSEHVPTPLIELELAKVKFAK